MTPKTGRPRGRPKGALTIKNRLIAEKASASGIAPQEIMLANARHFFQQALDAEATLESLTPKELGTDQLEPADQFKVMMAEVKKVAGFRQLAQDCAEGAAPYFAARIAPVQASSSKGEEMVPLAERLKYYLRRDTIAASEGKVVTLRKAEQ
jgi:hypothetical protein